MTPKFPICSDVTFVYMNCFPVIPIVNQVQMLPTLFKNMTLYWLWIVCWIIENLSTDTYSFIHCKIYTVNDKYVMKTEEKMDINVDFIEMMSLYKYKRWCTTSSSQGLTQPPPKSHQMNISWCSVHMLVVRINKALSNKTKETKILTNLSAMQ